MTDKQKQVLESIGRIFQKLNDAEKRQVVAFGEGMAAMKDMSAESADSGNKSVRV